MAWNHPGHFYLRLDDEILMGGDAASPRKVSRSP